ncbi:MAG: hydrogenase nickel incorporation protein HypB [Nocardioidaceae bacterium]|nr:hydrogenase nickel incorporation protein HypB [Nocardioidaceae bacterium]
MCLTCGCSDADSVRITNVNHRTRDHGHDHSHGHDHGHAAGPAHADDTATRLVTIEQDLLAKNDDLAAYNRGWLAERDMAALNLMSSPGAGKTSLLERTIREAPAGRTLCVIEGDQETLFDADRIRATGAPVVQINTGAGCHLDADMLHRGLVALDPPEGSLLFVENVGNLVCPALFDLGEAAKVVIISVTEGDDKPLKYPHMFAAADLVIINKMDLLPYVDFDVERCAADARSLRPGVTVLSLSVRTGEGIDAWFVWLDAV